MSPDDYRAHTSCITEVATLVGWTLGIDVGILLLVSGASVGGPRTLGFDVGILLLVSSASVGDSWMLGLDVGTLLLVSSASVGGL